MKKYLLFLLNVACISLLPAQTTYRVDWTQAVYPDYIYTNFEVPGDSSYIGKDTTQPGNLWQIGSPQKTFFSSAIGGQRSLVTDTLTTYPAGNVSSFTIRIINYSVFLCTEVSFAYRYETSQGLDGGTIEVSHDNGNSWQNIVTDSLYMQNTTCGTYTPPYSINDTVAALGKPGLSGVSNGTAYAMLAFMPSVQMFQNDTLMLRFTFASDSISESKDGWMIDYLMVGAVGEGIASYGGASAIRLFPDPVSDKLQFILDGKESPLAVSIFDVHGKLVRKEENVTDRSVDVSSLQDGIYFVTFAGKDFYGSRKFVVKK